MSFFQSARWRQLGRAAAGALLLGACTDRQPELPPLSAGQQPVLSTSFEGLAGWTAADRLASVTQEHARTGRYALKAGRDLEYSLGYSGRLGDLLPQGALRLRLTAWAFTERPTDALLILQVVRPDQNDHSVVYEKLELGRIVTRSGQWTPVSASVELPAEATPDSQLRLYLWYPNALNFIYLDDVALYREDNY
ncbi:hypothetical protein EJV47_19505 [Hymenobacter gummosus]|uniref:CBM-cenC domain-containing protein n=1 Tax=Hymenobacter gummosus TaxID=1776032 RepID=A0A431TZQ5_9BACT|nr:hypothetical protein [Hymenobacter gummosus]RTQ47602.1 hypothetical protein EJV47_19505 [Hymenobacter gummosus]